MMNNKFKLSIAALAFGAVFFCAPVKAYGQTDPRDQVVPSIDLDQADIRDALRQLFRLVNVDYTVAADVQGTVTLKLTNQTFEAVLRNLLNQVDSTYRVEGGVYNIIKKPVETAVGPGDNPIDVPATTKNPPVRIKIRHADPQLIINLINGQTSPSDPVESSSFSQYASSGNGGGGGGGFGGTGGGGGFGGSGGGGFGGGGGGGFGGGGGGFGGGGGGGSRGGGRG